jgi:hypothetical protein
MKNIAPATASVHGFSLIALPKNPTFGFGHDESHPLTHERRTMDLVHIVNPDGSSWNSDNDGNLVMGDNTAIDEITESEWNDLKAVIAKI